MNPAVENTKLATPGLPPDTVPEEVAYSLYEGVEYRDFWEGQAKSRLDQLERAIVADLLPSHGKRIIDVGCGYGRLAGTYLDRYDQVVFFDGSISLLQQARESLDGRGFFIAGDNNHMPFRQASFDSILMVRVFHHFEDSHTFLAEQKRILCDQGHLVFSYHCKRNARRVLRWLLGGKVENPFTLDPAGVGTTLISHHPKHVTALLDELGFVEPRYRGAGFTDKFVGILGPFSKYIPIGTSLAPLLGRLKLTPWVFCHARGTGLPSQPPAPSIEDLLQCPACGNALRRIAEAYSCTRCAHQYPLRDGIMDFRVK